MKTKRALARECVSPMTKALFLLFIIRAEINNLEKTGSIDLDYIDTGIMQASFGICFLIDQAKSLLVRIV